MIFPYYDRRKHHPSTHPRTPGAYLGEASISIFYGFLEGYRWGLQSISQQMEYPPLIPYEFYDWVAYRLHFNDSIAGWRNMILERERSEAAAFDRFWSLLDDYRVRCPKVVAQLINCRETYSTSRSGVCVTHSYPKVLSLISYTDDPGVFVCADEAEEATKPFNERFWTCFFPSFRSFKSRWDPSQLKIINKELYRRWAGQ